MPITKKPPKTKLENFLAILFDCSVLVMISFLLIVRENIVFTLLRVDLDLKCKFIQMAVLCNSLLQFINRKKVNVVNNLKKLWQKLPCILFSALLTSREGCEAAENLMHSQTQ